MLLLLLSNLLLLFFLSFLILSLLREFRLLKLKEPLKLNLFPTYCRSERYYYSAIPHPPTSLHFFLLSFHCVTSYKEQIKLA